MKNAFAIICSILFLGITSCNNGTKNTADDTVTYQCPMACEGSKTYGEAGSCPVCKMDLVKIHPENQTERSNTSSAISETSIFNLTSNWTDQNGENLKLEDLKGNVLVMVMVYTSCKAACPRLVADMRNIEERLPEMAKKHLKMVFVSIDPKTDTPERLKMFAQENQMDKEPWLFLRSNDDNTREFAAVVAVNYKKISPIDFSHSNIISVFDQNGEMVFQQEGLGVNSDATIKHIKEAATGID